MGWSGGATWDWIAHSQRRETRPPLISLVPALLLALGSGSCEIGAECRFSHDAEEIAAYKAAQKARACGQFARGPTHCALACRRQPISHLACNLQRNVQCFDACNGMICMRFC